MSNYSCKCPAPGCELVWEVTGKDWKEAFTNMFVYESGHVVEKHPDFSRVDIDKIRQFALENMKKI